MNTPPQAVRQHQYLRLKRVVLLGIKSLWLHRLRSLLTALGIVFGVCSVISMLAIGEGASYEAEQQIKTLGSDSIILKSVKPTSDQDASQSENTRMIIYGLTYDDLASIRETIPNVEIVVPGRVIRQYVWQISRRVDAEIVGTVAWYPEMRNHPVDEGRFFMEREFQDKENVAVLGRETADYLFPASSAVGQSIRVQSQYYEIVGVLENKQGADQISGPEADVLRGGTHRVLIPLSTARERFGEVVQKRRSGSREIERVELHEITVKAATEEDVIPVSQALATLLERNHKEKDYEIVVPLELLRRAERTKQIFNIVLGSIAAISLVVGGIGIMNIMLASVTERTREIGIRRALGAKKGDIVLQFLVETTLLSAAGGFIGVGLGLLVPYLVEQFANMRTIVTWAAPTVAFLISAIVGIVFGIYPAMRAAAMDPVEALRHE